MDVMPKWADVVLVPVVSLLLAMVISALVILGIGEDPWAALKLMVQGSFGSTYGWGYTLFYATNFIFTGLAFAVASHASMFNIGAEGQATLGGLGVALVCLMLPWPHWTLALPAAMVGGALFGAAWAFLPAWLAAKRGSHIVITTIMFNFIGAAVLNYMLVNVMRPAGSMDPASAKFPDGSNLPSLHDILAIVGIPFSKSAPANLAFIIALIACLLVWLLIWRTRFGFELRAYGKSESAAVYAGISPTKIIVIAMLISGGLAGMMAVNNVMGEAERLVLNSVEGAGFIGIAVALMGRNHPLGILISAILFGFLYQGGAELALWMSIPRELIVVIQGLVILFTGALDNMVRMPIEKIFLAIRRSKQAAGE
ncbi:ABC transporter permease [Aliiruegeria sabulilitoris]|uniref:ABC transporter permease n=1 Tax=Aliiruegeria sabulilitoris TaxID=1510458 RepID=UPI0008344AD4|nr:ABC transporter permease [Aliiruegeria sabulilitoris]NDR55941.1 ABC transporter permease [Pseudoruegeria sp. M32A2M]